MQGTALNSALVLPLMLSSKHLLTTPIEAPRGNTYSYLIPEVFKLGQGQGEDSDAIHRITLQDHIAGVTGFKSLTCRSTRQCHWRLRPLSGWGQLFFLFFSFADIWGALQWLLQWSPYPSEPGAATRKALATPVAAFTPLPQTLTVAETPPENLKRVVLVQ